MLCVAPPVNVAVMRRARSRCGPATMLLLAIAACTPESARDVAAARVVAPPATPRSRPTPPWPADCAPATGPDWTGRYRAGEAVSAGDAFPEFKGHVQVMRYVADVFRDVEGRWRAFVNVSGQTT